MNNIKDKSAIKSPLSSDTIKTISIPLSALFLAAVVSFSPEDPKLSFEDKQQGIANYLDNHGCNGNAFLEGKTQLCPDAE